MRADRNSALTPFSSKAAHIEESVRNRTESQLSLEEIRLYRQDHDVLMPLEVAEEMEPVVVKYQGKVTTGNLLRLPPPSRGQDAMGIRRAVDRILEADTRQGGGAKGDIVQEERMRRALGAVQAMNHNIQYQAQVVSRT